MTERAARALAGPGGSHSLIDRDDPRTPWPPRCIPRPRRSSSRSEIARGAGAATPHHAGPGLLEFGTGGGRCRASSSSSRSTTSRPRSAGSSPSPTGRTSATSAGSGCDNFVAIFNDPTQIGALTNTLFLAFASVILSNIAGLGLALGLNRGLKSRYALRVLFFMPVVLSPLAVSYVWKFIFEFNGPVNGVLRAMGLGEFAKPWVADPTWAIWTVLIVIVWQNTGFAMVIYMAGLAAVPVEIEEAAAIDGANLWQRFWNVTLPVDPPGRRDRDDAGPRERAAGLRPDHGADRRRARRRDRDAGDPGLQAVVRPRQLRLRRGPRARAHRSSSSSSPSSSSE